MKSNLELLEELEKYGFECEGGPLERTVQFIELKNRAVDGKLATKQEVEDFEKHQEQAYKNIIDKSYSYKDLSYFTIEDLERIKLANEL